MSGVRDCADFGKIYTVKRFRRWLLSGLTALLLILFFTTLTLWVRSYWREDLFSMQAFRSWQFGSNEGSLRFFRITTYPARMRWHVETRFSELKTTLKMRKLKSKSPEGVMKELAIYCLVYNLVRTVTTAAGLRQKVSPERISFIDAWRWLLWAEPGAPITNLIVNPLRPNRHEPRVVKDREDTYTKMTSPRGELRIALKNQGEKA